MFLAGGGGSVFIIINYLLSDFFEEQNKWKAEHRLLGESVGPGYWEIDWSQFDFIWGYAQVAIFF
jgi:hypothetical protein